MANFWIGFTKAAAEKKKKKESGMGRGGVLASGLVTDLAALPFLGATSLGTKIEKAMSPDQSKTFADKVRAARGLKTTVSHLPISDLQSGFDPVEDTVRVPLKPVPSSLAHELGHAGSVGKLWQRGPAMQALINGVRLSARAGTFAPGLALMTNTETGDKVAPYAGLAAAAPLLAEETSASLKGLRDLKRFRGTGTMLRGIPSLATSLGSYAAAPALSGYLAKRYIDKQKAKKGTP